VPPSRAETQPTVFARPRTAVPGAESSRRPLPVIKPGFPLNPWTTQPRVANGPA
jgi:hypothetical protein